MNEIDYYLILDEKEQGPFTIGQLRSLWNAGKITSKTYYFQDGMGEWNPLANIISRLELSPTKDTSPLTVKIAKSRVVYIMLGIFLGLLGIHNFYAGYFRKGVAQIIVSVLSVVAALAGGVALYSPMPNMGILLIGLGVLLRVFWLVWVILDLVTIKTDASGDAMV